MKLPNGDAAIVELAKLEDYCLSPTHPYGLHKARVFRAALGLVRSDAMELRSALLAAAAHQDALLKTSNKHGWQVHNRF